MKIRIFLIALLLAAPAFARGAYDAKKLKESGFSDEEISTLQQGGCLVNGVNHTKEECAVIMGKLNADQAADKKEKKNRDKETGCIYLGNAYAQAIDMRNIGVPIKMTYNNIRAALQNFPQFDPKRVVNNVYFDSRFAYPAGGPLLVFQISQICMGTYKGDKPIK